MHIEERKWDYEYPFYLAAHPNIPVADLYIVLYNSIISNPATGHGREGIYFGESGEHSLYDIGKAIGEALVALGKAKSPGPTTFTKEELDKYFGVGDLITDLVYRLISAQGFRLSWL